MKNRKQCIALSGNPEPLIAHGRNNQCRRKVAGYLLHRGPTGSFMHSGVPLCETHLFYATRNELEKSMSILGIAGMMRAFSRR